MFRVSMDKDRSLRSFFLPRSLNSNQRRSHTASSVPLVVDLDGTLVATDTLLEGSVALLRENPLYFLVLPLWLLRGRAHLKRQIARRTTVAADRLPYRQGVVSYLREERRRGRPLVLATASDQMVAAAVAAYLGLFSTVLASDGTMNMSGRRKAWHLCKQYGIGGFDYIGNSWKDVVVWKHARRALVAGMPRLMVEWVKWAVPVFYVFPQTQTWYVVLFQLLRCQQWVKNLLVFVPLLAAHRFTDSALLLSALGA